MTKRIICALCILVIILSVFSLPVSAYSFPFKDVKTDSWHYMPVKRVYDLGIMNGVSKTKFDPNGKLTREQAAMILYNLEGNGVSYSRYSFKDVKAGAWYADAVEWLYRSGITKGVSAEHFGIGRHITREDFITFLYRMYEVKWNIKNGNNSIYIRDNAIDSFKDKDKISPYAMSAMRLSVGICMVVTHDPTRHCNVDPIITGHNGYINPRGNCTRAEAAVMIGNAYTIDKYI